MRILSTILFALIIFVMVFLSSLICNISSQSVACETKSNVRELQIIEAVEPVVPVESYVSREDKIIINGGYDQHADHGNTSDPSPRAEHKLNPSISKNKLRNVLRSTKKTREFGAQSVEAVQPVVLVESYVPGEDKIIINGGYDQHADHGNTGHPSPRAEHKLSPSISKNKLRNVFRSTKKTREFDARLGTFLRDQGQCQLQFFMTWISPAASFGDRQLLVMESLFKAHPNACLIILSKQLDSGPGRRILKPLLDRGYRVAALDPDFTSLFNNTPAEAWLNDIQSGRKDPGRIPLAQNLSNLMRLAALYKYGGVYLDTDFIVLREFSRLRNVIGAQSILKNGAWRRLNNAVLVFDKNHPLLYEFMKEFRFKFDGNKWGHNGPYLVSRVIQRVGTKKLTTQRRYNFTVLPPTAFYPVGWTRIGSFFKRTNDPAFSKWAMAKLVQLKGETETYGIHLWNRQTGRTRIEEGSVMAELISEHCIICQNIYTS